MRTKTILAAVLTVSVAMLGAVGSAEAGRGKGGGSGFKGSGFHRHSSHHHGHHHRHFRHFYYVEHGGGCGYYYKKWQWTGLQFWKHKYYDCIS